MPRVQNPGKRSISSSLPHACADISSATFSPSDSTSYSPHPLTQALQCYSFQHVYFGPFDLSAMKLANISCPYGCSEAVLSLDTAPNPPTLSGTECYACVGTRPEDCTLRKSRRVQCHQDQSVCFQGNGEMSVDNFSVPVYIRTCHRPSCTVLGTTSPWTDIDLQGFCCEGPLCNGGSVTQPFTIASATAPPLAPHFLALLLIIPLLVGTLGGPLCLSP
ncbi:Ly6/PLAUR domain-containing protein 5 [Myotis davidii]|uniref:Ly6/PLAUR domain-containing protein 5 n=1 Tax=Myotis davidii TaxID=225400 RepID=L5M5T0_MYODS|nr:Ly6/PLAUR domain-containing protein 5 [Myotis davidii]